MPGGVTGNLAPVLKKALPAGSAALALVALTACSAGRHNPEFKIKVAQDTANATVAGTAVRDAYIFSPTSVGETARANVSISRLDPGADELVSVASPVSADITLSTGGRTVDSVPFSGDDAYTLTLQMAKVSQDLTTTAVYPVTLTFAHAGEVTLQVPVLRPGILNPGATEAPSSIPDNPLVVPLPERDTVSASPAE